MIGMATVKITITLQEEQLAGIRSLIEAQEASSVSGFVQHAVNISLHDAAGWQELLKDAMDKTGGPLTNKERHWADELLGVSPQKSRPAKNGRGS